MRLAFLFSSCIYRSNTPVIAYDDISLVILASDVCEAPKTNRSKCIKRRYTVLFGRPSFVLRMSTCLSRTPRSIIPTPSGPSFLAKLDPTRADLIVAINTIRSFPCLLPGIVSFCRVAFTRRGGARGRTTRSEIGIEFIGSREGQPQADVVPLFRLTINDHSPLIE